MQASAQEAKVQVGNATPSDTCIRQRFFTPSCPEFHDHYTPFRSRLDFLGQTIPKVVVNERNRMEGPEQQILVMLHS